MNKENKQYIDLHTHTIHSDGALSAEELVKKAKEAKLAAIAVADHEDTDGIDEAIRFGKKLGVEIIPAVEITTYPDPLTEHHILGYFIDYKNKKFQKKLADIQDARERKSEKVVKKLNSLGFEINYGDLKALASGTIVSPHIAWSVIADPLNKEKLKKGFGGIPNTGEFIREYLVPGAPAYVPREAPTPKEAVDIIHSVGGVAVIAHPCWTVVKKEDEKLVFDDKEFEKLVKTGIEGVEALSHRETVEDTKECVRHFTGLAKKYKLLVTGGSDFHGFGSAGKNLGFSDFYLKVPYSVLEDLKRVGGGR
jgi:predicted metal-dependent phosphoesterase TrpH